MPSLVSPSSPCGSRDFRRIALRAEGRIAHRRLIGLKLARRLVDRRRREIAARIGRRLVSASAGVAFFDSVHAAPFRFWIKRREASLFRRPRL
jgi:hypothetical protein